MAKKPSPTLDRGVAWTPALGAKVWSWRGHVNPEFQREYLERSRDVQAAFATRLRELDREPHLRPYFEAGCGRVSSELRPMMERALETREEKELPATPLDLDTEAALIALEIQHPFTSVPYWIAKEGLEFALRALVRCHELWSSAREHGYGSHGIWLMQGSSYAASQPEYAYSGWKLVRAALALADDPTYASLREIAAGLRASAPVVVRSLIASAFATERIWADEAAEAALAQGTAASRWSSMLVTVASIELGARLAHSERWSLYDEEILTVLARDGSAAMPVIVAALESAANNDLRKRYARLLAMVETEEAARAFRPWADHKAVGPIATKYFRRVGAP